MQYDLFEDNSETGRLKQEVAHLEQALGKVRRGLFARHNKLEKEILLLKQEVIDLRGDITPKTSPKILSM